MFVTGTSMSALYAPWCHGWQRKTTIGMAGGCLTSGQCWHISLLTRSPSFVLTSPSPSQAIPTPTWHGTCGSSAPWRRAAKWNLAGSPSFRMRSSCWCTPEMWTMWPRSGQLTMPYLANQKPAKRKHAECSQKRMRAAEQCVQDLVACMQEFDCFPFDPVSPILRTLQSAMPATDVLIADFN